MNPTMLINEFPVVPGVDPQGNLLITDLRALLRPASGPQYYQSRYDIGHAIEVLDLGADDWDGHGMTWHIATDLSVSTASSLLDSVFHAYVDYYCQAKLWAEAYVHFIGADGERLLTKEYGMDDGSETLHFYVYCKGYWDKDRSEDSDWTDLFNRFTGNELSGAPLPSGEIEHFISSKPVHSDSHMVPFVVVRHADSDEGYAARGINMVSAR